MPRHDPIPSSAPRTAAASEGDAEQSLHFGPLNLALLVAGLAAIIFGFAQLAAGSTVAAPLLLVLGFAVLVPLGIFV